MTYYSLAQKNEFSQKTNNFMLIVCLLYATCTNLIPFLGRAAEVILLLSFILILKRTNYKFINDRLFFILLTSILITIITWINIKITYPELSSNIPDIRYFSRLLLFIPIGYWLQGKEKNIILIWSAFILSTFISTFTRGGGISEWQSGLSGTRVDFGIINAQHTALIMATILIMAILYIPSIVNNRHKNSITTQASKGVIVFITIILSIAGLIISQTRGVWLAVIISTLITTFLFIIKVNFRFNFKFKVKYILFFFIITIPIVLVGYKYENKIEPIISERVKNEDYVVFKALDTGIDNLPYTSIGIRLHSWNEALKWIKEKPILGWGENAKKEIMSKSNFPQWVKDRYRHLHNFYLETTSSYGFIGLWILLYIYYFLLKSVNYLSIENKIPPYITWVTYVFFIVLFIANFFESYNSMWSGKLVSNLIFSASYSYLLFGKKE